MSFIDIRQLHKLNMCCLIFGLLVCTSVMSIGVIDFIYALIAQRIEYLSSKQGVAGSNPAGCTESFHKKPYLRVTPVNCIKIVFSSMLYLTLSSCLRFLNLKTFPKTKRSFG